MTTGPVGIKQDEPFRRLVLAEQQDNGPELDQGEFQALVLGALTTLQDGQEKLFTGQTELTEAYGRLVPRVQQLEEAAKWKAWAKTVGKAAIPFVGGLVAHYVPGLAKHLPAILEALGSVQ